MRQDRENLLYEVARMYYFQSVTMDSIAQHLSVSRSTVSRILTDARDAGIVQIRLERGDESSSALEKLLHTRFGVNAHVVADHANTSVQRTLQLASVAAQIFADLMSPGIVVGVSDGATMQSVVDSLPNRQCSGSSVVQLHGTLVPGNRSVDNGTRSVLAGVANAFGAEDYSFPVPALFDYATTKAAMWHERSVQRVRAIQSHAGLAVFSVGSLGGQRSSPIYTSGLLSPDDLDTLRRERVVGDLCTVMLRGDGSFNHIAVNERATGLTPAELQRVPRRLLIADDRSKALATLAALRARAATDLVIDEATAHVISSHISRFPNQTSGRSPS